MSDTRQAGAMRIDSAGETSADETSVKETSVKETGAAIDAPAGQGDSPGEAAEADSIPDVPSFADYRATVDAAYRAYAIDQGCTRVRELEESVISPAMRHIESADPTRHLTGWDNRLKSETRLTEKISHDMQKRGVSAGEAFGAVKDAIRYTFQYPDDRYTQGIYADVDRLKQAGFELTECRNSWANEEYKGINSRWLSPDSGQLFEIQFHTKASFEAKQETHAAYEQLRTLPLDHEEVRELRAYQRKVSATIPIPPGAQEFRVR